MVSKIKSSSEFCLFMKDVPYWDSQIFEENSIIHFIYVLVPSRKNDINVYRWKTDIHPFHKLPDPQLSVKVAWANKMHVDRPAVLVGMSFFYCFLSALLFVSLLRIIRVFYFSFCYRFLLLHNDEPVRVYALLFSQKLKNLHLLNSTKSPPRFYWLNLTIFWFRYCAFILSFPD